MVSLEQIVCPFGQDDVERGRHQALDKQHWHSLGLVGSCHNGKAIAGHEAWVSSNLVQKVRRPEGYLLLENTPGMLTPRWRVRSQVYIRVRFSQTQISP